MGGAKKPTAGNKDKSAGSKDTKKKKDKGEGGPKKAEIVVKVNEQQAMKIIQNSKVLTVQDLARQTGVKISAANAFLKESANKGIVKEKHKTLSTLFNNDKHPAWGTMIVAGEAKGTWRLQEPKSAAHSLPTY